MTRRLDTVKEWLNPDWVQHRTIPRMETGLRPNVRLDAAEVVVDGDIGEPDDIAVTASGCIVVSSGSQLLRIRRSGLSVLTCCSGSVSAIAARGDDIIAAVEGAGLIRVGPTGTVTTVTDDPRAFRGVTAVCALASGDVLLAVGATAEHIQGDWGRALLADDSSGVLLRVSNRTTTVAAEGLAWPSGLASVGDSEVMVSLSLSHRIEIRSDSDLTTPGRPVATNLPVYPGRIAAVADGYWVAAPYPRNRVTEMLLDESAFIHEMTTDIDRDQWFVPRLDNGSLFTEAMQMGQLRVLGRVKSWAPARSAGVVFKLDHAGRIVDSAQARVDSTRHGVTGVAMSDGQLHIALRGHKSILRLQADDAPGDDLT